MENKKKITIIGATGNLGVPVTKNLLVLGYEVTLIVRNIEKAKLLFGNNPAVKCITADLHDVPSLKKALNNTEYLYLNLSSMVSDVNVSFAAEREGVANIIEAVNKTSIKQILIISGLGVYQKDFSAYSNKFVPNIIRSQGHELIKKSGIPYTILHCTWFADSFLLFLRNGSYPIIGNTQNPSYFTNAFDYTNQLSKAIGNENTYNKEYPIQGTQGINHLDAAKQFFDVFDNKIKAKPMPTWLLRMLSVLKKEMKPVKDMALYFENSKEQFIADKFGTYKDLGEHKLNVVKYAEMVKTNHVYDYLFTKK